MCSSDGDLLQRYRNRSLIDKRSRSGIIVGLNSARVHQDVITESVANAAERRQSLPAGRRCVLKAQNGATATGCAQRSWPECQLQHSFLK